MIKCIVSQQAAEPDGELPRQVHGVLLLRILIVHQQIKGGVLLLIVLLSKLIVHQPIKSGGHLLIVLLSKLIVHLLIKGGGLLLILKDKQTLLMRPLAGDIYFSV